MTLDPSFEEAVSQLGKTGEQNLTAHPEMMELADYQDGLLDEKANEAVEEHLAVCHTCADMLVELAEPISLADETESAPMAYTASPSPRPSRPLVSRVGWLLAAALFVGGLLLFMENRRLQDRLLFFDTPHSVHHFSNLNSIDDLERNQAELKKIYASKDGHELDLYLNTSRPPTGSSYWLEMERDDNSIYRDEIAPVEGEFMFSLPASQQKPGTYRLTINEGKVGEEKVLVRYKFRIHASKP